MAAARILFACLLVGGLSACATTRADSRPRVAAELDMPARAIVSEAGPAFAEPAAATHPSPAAPTADDPVTRWALVRGGLDEAQHDWSDARSIYALVETHGSGDLAPVLARVRTYYAEGKPWHASELLVQAAQDRLPDVDLLLETGHAMLATNSPLLALEQFHRAREEAPADLRPRFAAAQALIVAGAHDRALAELAGVPLDRYPTHLLLLAGRCALVLSQPDAALEPLTVYLERRPADPDAWIDLARAHLLRDDGESARRALHASLQLRPASAAAFTLLGHVHYLAGEPVEALQCYELAIEDGARRSTVDPLIQRVARPTEVLQGRGWENGP